MENLRQALHKLDQKLAEAEAKSDLLIAQHRRARALSRASDARMAAGDRGNAATFDRMKRKVQSAEALSHANMLCGRAIRSKKEADNDRPSGP